MVRVLCVTVDDWIFEYIETNKKPSRSEFVARLLTLGIEKYKEEVKKKRR